MHTNLSTVWRAHNGKYKVNDGQFYCQTDIISMKIALLAIFTL